MLDTLHSLPKAVGVGYKPQHFGDILNSDHPVAWLEIHAENYMGLGGRPLAQLRALADRFPLSVHGVGLSIGGEIPLDPELAARSDDGQIVCDIEVPRGSIARIWARRYAHGVQA